MILGQPNPYAELFDARRWDVTKSVFDFARVQTHIAKHLVGDRIKHMMGPDIEDLKPGCGGICKDNGSVVAAFRETTGARPRACRTIALPFAHSHVCVDHVQVRCTSSARCAHIWGAMSTGTTPSSATTALATARASMPAPAPFCTALPLRPSRPSSPPRPRTKCSSPIEHTTEQGIVLCPHSTTPRIVSWNGRMISGNNDHQ